jgi:hypothetical protein
VHNNPIRYKDPTGHNLKEQQQLMADASKGRELWNVNQAQQKLYDSGLTTHEPNSDAKTIRDLESKINKATGDRVNLSKGFHVVMLENSTGRGSFDKRGQDEFKGEYFIIEDGKILKNGIGTSKSSVTPTSVSGATLKDGRDTAVNAGNDLMPGNYKLKGTLDPTGGTFNRVNIYKNNERMKTGDTRVPSTTGKEGQSGLQLHGEATTWSGGVGCSVLQGFQKWSEVYARNNKREISGDYHLIDMSKIK